MAGKYDDIIHLPHHVSERHPAMPMRSRAAQFSPFAALTGYEALIRETARLTGRRVELDEQQLEELDRRLRILMEQMPGTPEVRLTYFQPDEKKIGGAYVTETVRVRRIDPTHHTLELTDRRLLDYREVISIEGDFLAER